MEIYYLSLGLLSGLSLIFAIGPQNIFVIEQGLKNEFIFTVCLICSISDLILIFIGISLFYFLQTLINPIFELILNIALIIFLLHFIWSKFKERKWNLIYNIKNKTSSFKSIVYKTIGFTFLNPHVYSDTVFFLGNFSKNFLIIEKLYYGVGASFASFIFFFSIGYLSKYFSNYLKNQFAWKIINLFIIFFISFIIIKVLNETISLSFFDRN